MTCEAVNERGDGICRLPDGFVIFCAGLLPGERAAARIIKVSPHFAVARLVSDAAGSEIRREHCCTYALRGCGGCAFYHITREGQLSLIRRRVSDCLERIGGFDAEAIGIAPCLSPSGHVYRNKTSYPYADNNGSTRACFYARGSHRPVFFERGLSCPHENPVAAAIREQADLLCDRFGYSAYDELTGKGLLRHLTVRVSDSTGKAMAVISANADALPRENEFAEALTSAVPALASLWLNVNKTPGNTILSGPMRLIRGVKTLRCAIGSSLFEISPRSFFQVSTQGAELLYDAVYRFSELSAGGKIYDLYCGAGTIGLYLLGRFREDHPAGFGSDPPVLHGIEIVADAVENARRNAALNAIDNCVFTEGDVPRTISGIDFGSDGTVVLDPPRKGVEPALIDSLRTASVRRVVYVSCDPATLARDLRLLCRDGLYSVAAVQPVNMFPDTGHVETVVLLSQLKSKDYITVDIDLKQEDLTASEAKPTYADIRDYIFEHHNVKVSSLYIAQIKRKYGLVIGESYNKPKHDNSKQAHCPPDKEELIKEAVRYYKLM